MDDCKHKVKSSFKECFFSSKHYCEKCGARVSLCERDCLLPLIPEILLLILCWFYIYDFITMVLPEISQFAVKIICIVLFSLFKIIVNWLFFRYGKWTDEWDT